MRNIQCENKKLKTRCFPHTKN